MVYTTFDENTPDNIIQLEEQISLHVSIALPEVSVFPQAQDWILEHVRYACTFHK